MNTHKCCPISCHKAKKKKKHQVATPKKSGLCVWNRKRKITKWSKSSAWWRWRSAEILLFHIDWKISGIMIKVYNTRSYSALPGQTARVMWLERYDWKSVAMEILLKLNLLQCFGLVLDKEKTRWLQWSKNSEERREFKWEMGETGSTSYFLSAEINFQ